MTRAVEARDEKRAFERDGIDDWWQWWDRLSKVPALTELLAERERRFADPERVDPSAALWEGSTARTGHHPSRSFAGAALTQAGFQEVGSIWQQLDDYILLAVR